MKNFDTVFPPTDAAELIKRLTHPQGVADVVVDTDAFNGIDDQYALAYLARAQEHCRIVAVTAAPFYNRPEWRRVSKSTDPADGMEKSRLEILRTLDALGMDALKPHVYRGATGYLPEPLTPVPSEAAEKIIEISKHYTKEHPLYLVGIACGTNIASALLMDPTLRDRVVIIWQGGQGHHFGTCDDFNMIQDIDAGRIIFGCGAPVVQLPLQGVVSEFRFTRPELHSLLAEKNSLCDFLLSITWEHTSRQFDYPNWSKALVDMTAAAWLVSDAFFQERIVSSPIPQHDGTFSFPQDRHPIRYIYYVRKDPLTADMVSRFTR